MSNHQGEIDWEEVKSERVDFVYIKATEGMDYKDKYFEFNWDESDKAGLLRGAYHFFTFGSTGAEQANNFIEMVPYDENALPPVIDLEFTGNSKNVLDKESLQKELDDFIEALKNHYNKQPIIYVTHKSYEKYIKGSYHNTPIWIRNILRKPSLDDREEWLIWQYSNRGEVNGIDGFVDLNVFNGDRDRFKEVLCMVFSINEEIVIKSNSTDFSEIVKETDDGFIFGRMKIYKEGDTNSKTLYVPCIERYDDEGELIWEKEFEYPLKGTYINKLQVLKDNSIVFCVSEKNAKNNKTYSIKRDEKDVYLIENDNFDEEKFEDYKSYLLKCDENGKEVWKKDFNNKLLSSSDFFISDNGETYIIENTKNDSYTTIKKYGKRGDFMCEKSFDWEDKNIIKVLYNKNIGIILQDYDSSVIAYTPNPGFNNCFITLLDENLSLKWRKQYYTIGSISTYNDHIYITHKNYNFYTATNPLDVLLTIDNNGNYINSIIMGDYDILNIFKNEDVILGGNYNNSYYIQIINKNNDSLTEIKDKKIISSKFTSTKDGGYILTLQHEVKEFEQPENSTLSLYDTECVVMKFDNKYRLERKKTYDMYKDVAQEDLVFPLSNGKLVIIEKELEIGN